MVFKGCFRSNQFKQFTKNATEPWTIRKCRRVVGQDLYENLYIKITRYFTWPGAHDMVLKPVPGSQTLGSLWKHVRRKWRYGKTGDKNVQLVLQHCCKMNWIHTYDVSMKATPKNRKRFSHQLSGSPYISILVPWKGWPVQPNGRHLGIVRKITATCTSCPSKLSLNFKSDDVNSSKKGVLLQWQLRWKLMRMSFVSQNEVCQRKFSSTVVCNSRERLWARNLSDRFFRVFSKK